MSSLEVVIDQEEMDLLRKSIHEFAKKEVEPFYDDWEKQGNIPREFWNKLGEQGFLLAEIPEQYGGLGVPFHYSAVVIEEFSRLGFNAITANLAVHDVIVAHYILNYGTEAQKEYYLPKMATGELVGAIAMTEPGAGSDLQGIKTTATYDEERKSYKINGQKTFITNGQHCDFVIVAARTDVSVKPSKGMTLFIVDVPIEGFERGNNLEKIGLHACDTSELYFDDVWIKDSAILGEKNKGLHILMSELPRERLILAISAVAAMEGALDLTVQYTKERKLFGESLDHFQHTRFQLADLFTKVRIHRSFIKECIQLMVEGKLDTVTASMAKLSSTEAQGEVMDKCLQLFGGYGYMTEYPISRAFVDARIQRIYGGTSEVMKHIISKEILK
ncbi:acyl-CoA dehydrogenase family protein [Ornithinibacillus californiensis]|uniref:acyl-CoA dehydrogenase family protein n=1 Tax=Ornithinibacillus californiensis TaxID=161536 RepID=UPI000A048D73|nr:acyl-CoA dehydrogenase family protein [Ornithinibacillus californiensis]